MNINTDDILIIDCTINTSGKVNKMLSQKNIKQNKIKTYSKTKPSDSSCKWLGEYFDIRLGKQYCNTHWINK